MSLQRHNVHMKVNERDERVGQCHQQAQEHRGKLRRCWLVIGTADQRGAANRLQSRYVLVLVQFITAICQGRMSGAATGKGAFAHVQLASSEGAFKAVPEALLVSWVASHLDIINMLGGEQD